MKTDAAQLQDGDLRHGENVLKNLGMTFSLNGAHTATRPVHTIGFSEFCCRGLIFFLFP